MLEILLIVTISRKIATMLQEKGRKPAGYIVAFVLLWIGGEFIGGFVGAILIAIDNPDALDDAFNPMIYLLALVGAAIGGGIGYAIAHSATPLRRPRHDDDEDDYDDEDYDDEDYDRRRRRQRALDVETLEDKDETSATAAESEHVTEARRLPSARRQSEFDDDYDPPPRRRRGPAAPQGGASSSVVWIVLGIAGLLILAILGMVVVLVMTVL